jgi:(S)-citramalyl-CoA lyase
MVDTQVKEIAPMLDVADMAADPGPAIAWEPRAFARARLIAACALVGATPID